MVKKIIAVATAILMLCCMVPLAAFADDVLDTCPKCGKRTYETWNDCTTSIPDIGLPLSCKRRHCTSCQYTYYDWNCMGYTGYKEFDSGSGNLIVDYERNLISHLLRLGHTQTDIAKVIGVYPSTICRELRRGEVELLNSDKWIYYKTYSPQKAQMQADYMKTAHGPDLKIGNRRDYLAALEAYMLTGSSPEDAISKVGDDYGIRISKTTCYRYIKMRLFPSLCYKHLPQGHPKKGKGQVHRSNVAHPGHRSIERRAFG